MVLVDTSVWIVHFRLGESCLEALLVEGKVACHPFIIGELACGNISKRKEILGLLEALPEAVEVSHEEALHFIEQNKLMGIGLGYVDVHILASARLSGIPIWTKDRLLKASADRMNIAFR